MTRAGRTISRNADTTYAFLSVRSFLILTLASIEPITIIDIGTVMSPMSLNVSDINPGILHGMMNMTIATIDATDTELLNMSSSANLGFFENR